MLDLEFFYLPTSSFRAKTDKSQKMRFGLGFNPGTLNQSEKTNTRTRHCVA